MGKITHSKSVDSLEERYAAQAAAKLEKAKRLPPSKERDALEREARQIHVAAKLQSWLSSPGLKSPS